MTAVNGCMGGAKMAWDNTRSMFEPTQIWVVLTQVYVSIMPKSNTRLELFPTHTCLQ